jgi:hypothetical protein
MRAARLAAFLLLAAACDRTPEPAPKENKSPVAAPALPKKGPETPATSPAQAPRTDLVWQAPSTFAAETPKSRMRLASYKIPKSAGDAEDGELSVFHFGSKGGGGVEANIKRWVDQFSDVPETAVKRSERTMNGLTQHIVEIESGTFSSGMPGGPKAPKKNFGMIAVVVETPHGLYFFKATGPTATLQASRSDVFAFLDSIKPAPS